MLQLLNTSLKGPVVLFASFRIIVLTKGSEHDTCSIHAFSECIFTSM
jgi:hypothetical protein